MSAAHDDRPADSPLVFWGLSLLVLVCLLVIEPWDPFFTSRPEASPEENAELSTATDTPRRVALVVLAGAGLFLLARGRAHRVRLEGLLPWAVLAFLGWALLSAGWADEPGTSLRKVGSLTLAGVAALGVARALSMRGIAGLILVCTTAYWAAGVGGELLCGTFRPYQAAYRFQGVSHVAFTAWCLSLMALSALMLLHDPPRRPGKGGRLLLGSLVGIALTFLVLTKTRASVAAFLAGLVCYLAVTWPWRRSLAVLTAVGTPVLGACWALQMATGDALAKVMTVLNLGREAGSADHLTGRVEIWEDLVPFLKARLWHGYGYGSFWTVDRLLDFGASQGWAVPDSHNTYIDLTLGVGLVGLALYLLVLLLAGLRAAAWHRRSGDPGFALVLAAVVVSAVNGTCVAAALSLYTCTFLTFILLLRAAFLEGPRAEGGGP